MLSASKVPSSTEPLKRECIRSLDRLALGEICDGVVALDRDTSGVLVEPLLRFSRARRIEEAKG